MNAFVQKSLATLVLAGVVAAPASANVQRDVQQAISGGNINVSVSKQGVATLTGYTDTVSRTAALNAARRNSQVQRVINLIENS